jgi:hypothetical protein
VTGWLRIAVVLVGAAIATIAANVILLGVATGHNDPVGRLNPRAALVSSPAQPLVRPAPPPARGEHERADD